MTSIVFWLYLLSLAFQMNFACYYGDPARRVRIFTKKRRVSTNRELAGNLASWRNGGGFSPKLASIRKTVFLSPRNGKTSSHELT